MEEVFQPSYIFSSSNTGFPKSRKLPCKIFKQDDICEFIPGSQRIYGQGIFSSSAKSQGVLKQAIIRKSRVFFKV